MDHNPINPRGTVHLGRFHVAGPRVLYRPLFSSLGCTRSGSSLQALCARERERIESLQLEGRMKFQSQERARDLWIKFVFFREEIWLLINFFFFGIGGGKDSGESTDVWEWDAGVVRGRSVLAAPRINRVPSWQNPRVTKTLSLSLPHHHNYHVNIFFVDFPFFL
jgi:hypothetical protein